MCCDLMNPKFGCGRGACGINGLPTSAAKGLRWIKSAAFTVHGVAHEAASVGHGSIFTNAMKLLAHIQVRDFGYEICGSTVSREKSVS